MFYQMRNIEKTKQIDPLIVPEAVLAGRSWVKEMDLLRGIACIGVVVGHSIVDPHTTPPLDIINQLVTIIVPLFLFLSAFLAFYTSPNGVPRGYLQKHLLRVGLPYVLWVTIYTWTPVLTGTIEAPSFLEYLIKLTGSAFHLYFIPIVIQFYMVFMLNRFAWFRRLLYTPWTFIGSLGLMLGIQIIFSGPLRAIFPEFYLIFPAWCFYFVLGAWVARWWEKIQAWLTRPWRLVQLTALFTVGLLLTRTLSQAAAFQPPVQLAALLIFPFLIALANRAPKWVFLETISRHSFGIYLIHRLPFNQTQHIYATLDPYLFFLTSLILQGGIGYSLTRILSLLPGLAWTVGARSSGERHKT